MCYKNKLALPIKKLESVFNCDQTQLITEKYEINLVNILDSLTAL